VAYRRSLITRRRSLRWITRDAFVPRYRNHLREESESLCRLAAADARDDRPAAIGNSDARAEAAAGARLALGAALSIGDMASDNVQTVPLFLAGRTACHDSHNIASCLARDFAGSVLCSPRLTVCTNRRAGE
jgi:hypothetical protein